MIHLSAFSRSTASPADIEPDKRWLGTLLCCLSAVVTTVIIVLVATFLVSSLVSTDDRDIARGESPGIDHTLAGDSGIAD